MKIKGETTIAAYQEKKKKKIEAWIEKNFVEGAVTWKMDGANEVKITDGTGDTMIVPLSEIN